jgi:hypothetical protein
MARKPQHLHLRGGREWSMLFIVELLEVESDPEVVFTGEAWEAAEFVAAWLEEPLDYTIAVRKASDRERAAVVPRALSHA